LPIPTDTPTATGYENLHTTRTYDLSVTTQGPLYPPSEIMDENGDFVVIGRVNRPGPDGGTVSEWGSAVVSASSPLPPLRNLP